MSESIKHLDGTLGESQVEHFISTRALLHLFDKGDIIIDSHLCPRPGPEFWVTWLQGHMFLTVHGAAIVSDPDVVTGISQQQVHR